MAEFLKLVNDSSPKDTITASIAEMPSSNPPISVVSWSANRVDAFATGADKALYHKFWDGQNWVPSLAGDWEALTSANSATPLASAPSAVAWGVGRFDVFAISTKGTLLHKFFDGSAWLPAEGMEDLGGELAGDGVPPAVVSWGKGRVDVFALGKEKGALTHLYWDGSGWRGWETLATGLEGPPSAVSKAEGRVDIFAVGNGGGVVHLYWDGSKWEPQEGLETLGGAGLTGTLGLASWSKDRLDVLGLEKEDKKVYHKYYDGSQWQPAGDGINTLGKGPFTSSPSAVSWGNNRLDVFGLGETGSLSHKTWWGEGWYPEWQDFEELGGKLEGTPGVGAWGTERLDIFAIDAAKGSIVHKFWDGSQWSPSATEFEDMGGKFL